MPFVGAAALLVLTVLPAAEATTAPVTRGSATGTGTGTAQPGVSLSTILTSPAGSLPSGPRSNGTAVLPDGRYVTPVGRSVAVDLEPQNATLSHDGTHLYVSSEGVDDSPPGGTNHDATAHARFISVIDTKTMTVTARVPDNALHAGIAESADGRTVYVSEGQTDSLGVFAYVPAAGGGVGTLDPITHYALSAASPTDYPTSVALSPDGSRAYLSGFSGDTLITVALTATAAGPAGTVLSRVPTGSYPYTVVVSADGTRGYVSNWGLYNGDAALGVSSPIAPPPASYGGYNTTNSSSVWTYDLTGTSPKVIAATRIGEDLNGAAVDGGSTPSGLALSPDGATLAVTSSNDDLVELLDTTRTAPSTATPSTNAVGVPQHPSNVIDMRVLVGSAAVAAPTGAQPDAVTWSPDGKVLFVGEGERNDVAVVDPAKVASEGIIAPVTAATGDGPGTAAGPNRDAVIGRIPTAWYPSSLTVSPDSRHLYVTSMKGLGSGPNTFGATPTTPMPDSPAATYIPNTIKGRVTDVALTSACQALSQLTGVSDQDNGLVQPGSPLPPTTTTDGSTPARGDAGNGYVVPTAFGQPASSKIKHVFLIIKENRPYDQVLGDLPGTEADSRYTTYPQFLTPNTHALATQFAVGDNYYATTETSTQGHYSIDTGQVNEFTDKVTPSSYANKYPYGPFDTTPENLPEGGFIWNNAARHGVHTTIFGEGTVVTGIGPAALGSGSSQTSAGQLQPGVQQNAFTTTDPFYPSQANLQGSFSAAPGNPAQTLYPFNDEGRASAFADDLAAAQGREPAVAGNASAATIGQLNVMILFDDHTNGVIAGAPTPEREVAENDHGLGRVMDTISHSTYWKDSAVFVTEDDTQGGQDHVDAYRSFGLVASPWAQRGHISHVHTSFSSMQKTIDLLLGLPPTSLQELTATPMSDDFLSSGSEDLTPYTAVANNTTAATNPTVATAPNAALRRAAQLALHMPRGIDQAGALLPLEDRLAYQGELQAGDPNVHATTNVVNHTLPTGSPDPITLADQPAGAGPAADTCLASTAPTSTLPEDRRPAFLLGAAGLVALAATARRRRRRQHLSILH